MFKYSTIFSLTALLYTLVTFILVTLWAHLEVDNNTQHAANILIIIIVAGWGGAVSSSAGKASSPQNTFAERCALLLIILGFSYAMMHLQYSLTLWFYLAGMTLFVFQQEKLEDNRFNSIAVNLASILLCAIALYLYFYIVDITVGVLAFSEFKSQVTALPLVDLRWWLPIAFLVIAIFAGLISARDYSLVNVTLLKKNDSHVTSYEQRIAPFVIMAIHVYNGLAISINAAAYSGCNILLFFLYIGKRTCQFVRCVILRKWFWRKIGRAFLITALSIFVIIAIGKGVYYFEQLIEERKSVYVNLTAIKHYTVIGVAWFFVGVCVRYIVELCFFTRSELRLTYWTVLAGLWIFAAAWFASAFLYFSNLLFKWSPAAFYSFYSMGVFTLFGFFLIFIGFLYGLRQSQFSIPRPTSHQRGEQDKTRPVVKFTILVSLLVPAALAGVFAWQRWPPHEQPPAAEAARRNEEKAAAASSAPAAAPTKRTLKPFETFKDCAQCPEMVAMPAGSFMMGSPASEPERVSNEGPQQRVTIQPFAISKTEVTFAQWDACVTAGGCNAYKPSDQGWGRGSRPVVNISWKDAQAYASWLSQRTKRNCSPGWFFRVARAGWM